MPAATLTPVVWIETLYGPPIAIVPDKVVALHWQGADHCQVIVHFDAGGTLAIRYSSLVEKHGQLATDAEAADLMLRLSRLIWPGQ